MGKQDEADRRQTAHLGGRSATSHVAQAAQQSGRDVLAGAGDEAQHVLRALRGQAGDALEEGKVHLAAQIAGVARSVRRGSSQLQDDALPRLASLGDALAGELEAAGRYLGEQPGQVLLDDLGALARRHRGLVIGGLVVAGALAAYFIPARSTRRGSDET